MIDHILEEDIKFQQYYFNLKKIQSELYEDIIPLDV